MQWFFSICQSISVIYHIYKLKHENRMIISIDSGKAFNKIQHPVIKKTLQKAGIGETLLLLVAKSCPTLRWPYGPWPTRLLCPWDFLDNITRVGCNSLPQGIFLTQGFKPWLLHCKQILYYWATREAPGLSYMVFITLRYVSSGFPGGSAVMNLPAMQVMRV